MSRARTGRLAAMVGKPQRSSVPPCLEKDLTGVLQVRTMEGNAGRHQHGMGSAADLTRAVTAAASVGRNAGSPSVVTQSSRKEHRRR